MPYISTKADSYSSAHMHLKFQHIAVSSTNLSIILADGVIPTTSSQIAVSMRNGSSFSYNFLL